jgi:hypothetical protein
MPKIGSCMKKLHSCTRIDRVDGMTFLTTARKRREGFIRKVKSEARRKAATPRPGHCLTRVGERDGGYISLHSSDSHSEASEMASGEAAGHSR